MDTPHTVPLDAHHSGFAVACHTAQSHGHAPLRSQLVSAIPGDAGQLSSAGHIALLTAGLDRVALQAWTHPRTPLRDRQCPATTGGMSAIPSIRTRLAHHCDCAGRTQLGPNAAMDTRPRPIPSPSSVPAAAPGGPTAAATPAATLVTGAQRLERRHPVLQCGVPVCRCPSHPHHSNATQA